MARIRRFHHVEDDLDNVLSRTRSQEHEPHKQVSVALEVPFMNDLMLPLGTEHEAANPPPTERSAEDPSDDSHIRSLPRWKAKVPERPLTHLKQRQSRLGNE